MFLWMGDGPRRFQFCSARSARSTLRLVSPAAGPPIPEIPCTSPDSLLRCLSAVPLTSVLASFVRAGVPIVLVPVCLSSLLRGETAVSVQGFLLSSFSGLDLAQSGMPCSGIGYERCGCLSHPPFDQLLPSGRVLDPT